MPPLSKDPHVRAIQQQLVAKLGAEILSAPLLVERTTDRALVAADRDARDLPAYVETPADAVTVRRTALPYYSADAMTPVESTDEALPWDGTGEPTTTDLRRQLADVGTALRLAKDEARAKTLAGVRLTVEEIDAHAAYIGKLKAAQWRLTKQIAEIDGAAGRVA